MEQCPFYKWGQGHIFGPSVCVTNDKKVSPKVVRHHCKAPCSNYLKCPHYINEMSNNDIFKVIIEYVSKIKSYDIDNKEILSNLSEFRKEVLDKKEEYRDLLVYHDRMSKIIVDAIRNTRIDTIDEFLVIIYENYILKINEFIVNKSITEAIDRYNKMFELFIVQFSLNREYAKVKNQYKHPELYGRYALVKRDKQIKGRY